MLPAASPSSVKPDVRVLAFDDAPFGWDDARVPVVGVVVRGAGYVDNVLRTDVAVDGDDATARLLAAIEACPQRPDLRAVLLDGCALAGFNVVDVEELARAARLPVLTVTRGEPDYDAMLAALRKHVPDWERKWRLLSARPQAYPTEGQPLYVRAVGLDRSEVAELLARTTARGHLPEALRLAHLVAGVVR